MMTILLRRVSHFVFTFLILVLLLPLSQALGGEEDLFTSSAPPDAMLLVDWSGSMAWNPAGASGTSTIFGTDQTCTTLGAYNATSRNVKCSRQEIAKRAIFALLDADGNGIINADDETALDVRVGYMKFYSAAITTPNAIGSRYSQIFCGQASCTITTGGTAANNATATANANHINGQGASGATPLNAAMAQAKTYLDNHKAADPAKDCRKKYLIIVSDGADSSACGLSSGSECIAGQYTRRRDSVRQAKLLADAGYKVFVIGLGAGMPTELINTLNWMAYYGGTENPSEVKTGVDPTGADRYKPEQYTATNVCTRTTGTANEAAQNNPRSTVCGTSNTPAGYYAVANDPGRIELTGYAFMGANAVELGAALQAIIKMVQQGNYSFTNPSVQTIRTEDENYLYKASFEPANDPFWKGHLKQYEYQDDGTLKATARYDAGERFPASRTIKTYLGNASGTLVDFTPGNITPDLLNTADNAQRDAVINYIRGVNNPDGWMLGDISRSGPVTIGTPNAYYRDLWDTNNSFAAFRDDNVRSSANGNRIVVVGTNAGQVHGFRTSTGTELWSFIPPNLLPKLKDLVHTEHPSDLPHQYFVDGPIRVADAWLGPGDGKAKSAHNWKTLLILGEGRGVGNAMWSSSSSCSSGFSSAYSDSSATPYYCGYHALDVTNTTSPSYMWNLDFRNASSSAPYMGDPWNEMKVGRVRMSVAGTDTEKWVGFIGGGYNPLAYSAANSDSQRGKAFYAVDLRNGEIIWSYTYGSGSGNTNSTMTHSIPAPATLVDTDGDGFIDTAYVGDLWGNMWRFTLCRASDMTSGCNIGSWDGALFLRNNMTSSTPVYTAPVVALDGMRRPWVFWGTGDKNNPIATNTQDYFYGVQDTGTTRNATSITSAASDTGWRITLDPREKVLSESIVFNKILYFATYIPPSAAERASNPCAVAGKARLYAVEYLTGVGIFENQKKWIDIGDGIPSDVGITLTKDGNILSGDIVVETSHAPGVDSRDKPPISMSINSSNMLYWKDRRIE